MSSPPSEKPIDPPQSTQPLPPSSETKSTKKPSVSDFTFGSTIGFGSYGRVVLATHKETQVQYAAKILVKENILKNNLVKYVSTERDLLRQLNHPNIIKLLFTFQTPLELCNFFNIHS